jgi:subtilase family serine protease
MPRTERNPWNSRRRLAPTVTQLEGRALLNATSLTHPVASAVHVDVSKKVVHAEKVAPTKAKAVKPVHAAVIHAAKAKPAAKVKVAAAIAPRKLTNEILSPYVTVGAESASPLGGTLTPAQLETAYGVSTLGTANQGQGETIGIVDVFADPNIIADANVYSTEYSLPTFNVAGNPTLTAYVDTATGTVANSSKNSSSGNDTSSETSLDVEEAHAMAPKANILLVEVSAGSGSLAAEFASLLQGIQYAASHGASVVSLSYGYTESGIGTANVQSLDSTYLATAPITNIAVTVSTGDSGYPGYPGTSPEVIAVGGTSLHLASAKGKYGYETAWGGVSGAGSGGGGTSAVFGTPSFQSNNGVNYGARSVPDVSLVADPYTAVSVYDSWDSQKWTAYGGTSVASPLFAGIVALAQQDIPVGDNPLTSAQIDAGLYAAYNSPNDSTYFHDVVLGNNHDVGTSTAYYSATTGYDEATGIGSPIAGTLVPYLASLATSA